MHRPPSREEGASWPDPEPPMSVWCAAGVALLVSATVVVALPAGAAAAGCSVNYAVSSQWPGGFGANVSITNLGDPLTSWTLTWSFSAGQTVTQAWNTSLTQSGSAVTANNVSYNGSVPTNGTVSFGFNGSWTGSNPAPTSFALNGVACTGGTTPTTRRPPRRPRPPTDPPPPTTAAARPRAPFRRPTAGPRRACWRPRSRAGCRSRTSPSPPTTASTSSTPPPTTPGPAGAR